MYVFDSVILKVTKLKQSIATSIELYILLLVSVRQQLCQNKV